MAGRMEFGKLLDGAVVAISGLENPERAQVRDKALAMGAQYRPDWGPGCTLLLAVFPKAPKVRRVKDEDGTIVHKDWIHECHRQRQLCPMDPFLMHSGRPWVHRSPGADRTQQQGADATTGAAAQGAGAAGGVGARGRGGGGRGRGEEEGGENPSLRKRRLVVPKAEEEEEEEERGAEAREEVGRSPQEGERENGGVEGHRDGSGQGGIRARRGGGILAAGQREREREREKGREREKDRDKEEEESGQGAGTAGGVGRDRDLPGGGASPLGVDVVLANVEDTEARRDILGNLAYLRQQSQKPPESEMLSVAVEGLLACFEDTLEAAEGALKKGDGSTPLQAAAEELQRWPVVPHPLRPLTRVHAQPGSFPKAGPAGRGAPPAERNPLGRGEGAAAEAVEGMRLSLGRYTQAVERAKEVLLAGEEGDHWGVGESLHRAAEGAEIPQGSSPLGTGHSAGNGSPAEARQGNAPGVGRLQQQGTPAPGEARAQEERGSGVVGSGRRRGEAMRPVGAGMGEGVAGGADGGAGGGAPGEKGGVWGAGAVPGVEEALVRRDVEENVAFLRSQEDKPPESDVLRVAVEGLQVCFEDAVAAATAADHGSAERALKGVFEEWPVVPYPLRRLVEGCGGVPWRQGLLSELKGVKEVYCNVARGMIGAGGKGGEERDGVDPQAQRGCGLPLVLVRKGAAGEESADTDSLEGDGELLDVSSYRRGI